MPFTKTISCALLLLCCSVYAIAQDAKGTIYRKISNDRLANVLVTNLNTHIATLSDELGNFTIKGKVNDTLQFTTNDYTPQRQMYTGYGMIVYMQPEIKLGEVTVRSQSKKQELNDIMRSYKGQGTFYNGKPPALSFLTNPVTGVYELFGKTPGRARRFAAFAKREVEANEVDRRYNKSVVMRVTGLTDTTAALKFMDFWRPSFDDLKTWADYDLIKQIKTKYEYYRKEGDSISPPKLY